jgi:hypothetical protein
MLAMTASAFLRYLLLPLHGTVLVLIAVLALGMSAAQYAGLFGYPLQLMLASWLFNYAYILLEAIANGAREPPVLAIEMLNPLHESRPLFQFVLVFLIALALSALSLYVDAPLAAVLALLAFIALPASTGALAIGTSVWQAVHPAVLWHIARTLGWTYLAMLLLIAGTGVSALILARIGMPPWLLILLGVYAWLALFALIGGALFEYRAQLGHEPVDSPERRQARVQSQVDRERGRFLARVHGEARGGNLPAAWQSIEQELASHGHAFEFYDWLLDRLSEREDARLAYRLAQDYIARALGRDNARATLIAQRRLKLDPDFRPRTAAQCLRLAELLRLSGDRSGAQAMLRDFSQHFPDDPAVLQAHSMLDALK